MKRLAHFILIVIALSALLWALWRGLTQRHEEPDATAHAATAEGAEKEPEQADAVVAMEKDKWEKVGIEMAEVGSAEIAPRRIAFGRVLDPSPLVTLDGELAAAEAAIAASREEFERTQKLLAAGENTSRKTFEAAEAQFRADEIKADSLRRQASLQWGAAMPAENPARRPRVRRVDGRRRRRAGPRRSAAR